MHTTFDVEFGDPTTTLSDMYGALIGLVVDLDVDAGYPGEDVYVMRVDRDGDVVVCELVNGEPQMNSAWVIPPSAIRRVIVKLGEYA